MQELKVGQNDAGQRLDKYLRKALPGAGSSLLYKQLRKKNITLNGQKAQGGELLRAGDLVQCFFGEETFAKFQAGARTDGAGRGPDFSEGGAGTWKAFGGAEYERAFRTLQGIAVLYEDEHILVLDKPAGVLTQKAKPQDRSLNEWMIGYLIGEGSLSETDLRTFHPSVCNRLDRGTSGLVLCGKSLAGLQALGAVIKERRIRKFYRTVCSGAIGGEMTLEGYLKKDPEKNKVSVRREAPENERDASFIKTRYMALCCTERYSYLEVELITGKPHQIRAHLASAWHPLLGDVKYGGENAERVIGRAGHLLHADHVIFPDWETLPAEYARYEDVLRPLSGKRLDAPLPEDFRKALDALGLQ